MSFSGDLSCVLLHLLDERLQHSATVGEIISHLVSYPGLPLLYLLESLMYHDTQIWVNLLSHLILLGQDFIEFLSDDSPLLSVFSVSLIEALKEIFELGCPFRRLLAHVSIYR